MDFSDLLNHYMTSLNCTAKELSEYSNLSPQIISRYRNGSRKPTKDTQQLMSLAEGFHQLAQAKGYDTLTVEALLSEFTNSLSSGTQNIEVFTQKFNALLDAANVNMKKLSLYMHLDISFLYKIRQGQRKPYNIDDFAVNISKYIIKTILLYLKKKSLLHSWHVMSMRCRTPTALRNT